MGHTETAAVAYFTQFTNTLYMSFDASCETGLASAEPCLQKGDLIFITDANWGTTLATTTETNRASSFFGGATVNDYSAGFADTTDLYTITKIWKAEETATTATLEDKFRITVDKNINWDGSKVADPDGDNALNTGSVQIVKFTPATTGTFTYVSQCSNRGPCNGDDGHVHVRLAVLEPRPLQRRRRALRVLQGLHQRQLRHAELARGVSARIISQRSAKGRVRTKAHDEGAGCRVYTRGATARRGFRIEK